MEGWNSSEIKVNIFLLALYLSLYVDLFQIYSRLRRSQFETTIYHSEKQNQDLQWFNTHVDLNYCELFDYFIYNGN